VWRRPRLESSLEFRGREGVGRVSSLRQFFTTLRQAAISVRHVSRDLASIGMERTLWAGRVFCRPRRHIGSSVDHFHNSLVFRSCNASGGRERCFRRVLPLVMAVGRRGVNFCSHRPSRGSYVPPTVLVPNDFILFSNFSEITNLTHF